MSQLITTGGAPAPAQPAAESPHLPQIPQPAEAPKTEPVKTEPEPSLAELIKSQRAAREEKARESARAKDLETKLAEREKELEALRRGDFEDDPVGYGNSRGWTREQKLFYGQALLYDLAPDQAPQDFREKMFEQRLTRKEREAEKARTEAAQRQMEEHGQAHVAGFVQKLEESVSTFDEGTFPESTAWFGEDRDTYIQSLFATATNMAEAAAAEGKVADLRPASVAKVLEAEVARKMSERDRRVSARKGAVPQGAGGVQSAEAMSTRNMTGSGAPRPPAETEAERIRRAAEVAFRPR